jgi:hypothetical protein
MQCHLLHQYILDENFYQKPMGREPFDWKGDPLSNRLVPHQFLKLLTHNGAKPS